MDESILGRVLFEIEEVKNKIDNLDNKLNEMKRKYDFLVLWLGLPEDIAKKAGGENAE